ncbi:MAG: tRNA uridine(34) 5-carboxymethylaminomethyl modification radical SAM/GNAT enzyme Elp3 [Candidatus Woesearchaeota archaeon]
MIEKFAKALSNAVVSKKLVKGAIAKEKVVLAREMGVKKIPTDIEVLLHSTDEVRKILKEVLVTKPVRTGSGVTVVAIMTKPLACPHGKCTMCPGGPNSFFGSVPQSYTGNEPATMRAMRNAYDAYLQVMNRLQQYILLGQNPEKVEMIIMGGTFPATSQRYQEEFVRDALQAMNDFSTICYADEFDIDKFKNVFKLPGSMHDETRAKEIREFMLKYKADNQKSLQEVQEDNDLKSRIKCIGMTIETKPDWGFAKHGNKLLELGCTRIELGTQSPYDSVLDIVHRGHSMNDTYKSTQELRDLGFKLNFHIMPGLPGVDEEKDVKGLLQWFSDSRLRPDMVKVYPCLVMPGTPLFDDYKAGKFIPLSTEEAGKRIAILKSKIPRYCRIMRIQRDIPTKVTEAGADITNLRQYINTEMKKNKWTCNCIRCRERIPANGERRTRITHYTASKGTEYFIEELAGDQLLGFCRLRFPSASLRAEITKTTGIIRELHVYGRAIGILDESNIKDRQHKGVGKKLMETAEDVSLKHEKNKMVVISGIGVRGYYRKLGYALEGPYMVKAL